MRTDDLRIHRVRPLIAPAILAEDIPLTDAAATVVANGRRALEAILDGRDARLAVIVGPCSIHDPAAALDYAQRLKPLADAVADRLLLVMRVYFEKPRTTVGWKGLINDPDLDESFHINKGLRLARQLLADIADDRSAGRHRIPRHDVRPVLRRPRSAGARSARAPPRARFIANSRRVCRCRSASRTAPTATCRSRSTRCSRRPSSHLFPSLTKEGAPAILETTGNPYCHVVLRGGSETGPNFDAAAVAPRLRLLAKASLPQRLMIDASHGNSGKDPARQADVVDAVIRQKRAGDRAIRALMIESHLVGGRQDLGGATAALWSEHHRRMSRFRRNAKR